jgi:hypothetical protein
MDRREQVGEVRTESVAVFDIPRVTTKRTDKRRSPAALHNEVCATKRRLRVPRSDYLGDAEARSVEHPQEIRLVGATQCMVAGSYDAIGIVCAENQLTTYA